MKEKKKVLVNFTFMHKKFTAIFDKTKQDKHNTITNQCFQAYLPYMTIYITISLWYNCVLLYPLKP